MQVMIEKLIDLENKELYLIFIDYSKAFDKVNHGRLFDIMLDMGIPKHLVESWKGYGIKADREDSGYTTLKSGLAVNTFS